MDRKNSNLVLIVDDNPNNIQVLATIMAECGYELGIAQNALEVYQFLEENIPELILLDVEMPDIDGYEVCKTIKADPRYERIPVIFLTVKSETEDIVRGFDLGAVDYITKPFKRKELISRVRTHISLKRSRDELARKNEELEHVLQIREKLEDEKDLLTEKLIQHQNLLEKKVIERTKELAAAKERIKKIVGSITDGFAALDKNWNYIYVNDHHYFPHNLKAKDVIGKSIWDIFPGTIHTNVYDEFHRAMEERVAIHFEAPSSYDDSWLEISVYPFDDGICCYFKNITEKKKYEKEMKRLSGLDLIGQMAAGISHEIRNPMTTVRGFLQLLSTKDECSNFHEYFTLMIDELDRANSIITEFLSMGNTRTTDLQELDLNTIILDISPLLHADASNQNKQIRLETSSAIPCLPLNRNEIRQLILNLYRNGLEAMSEGKILTIRTYMENGQVVLAVKDQGEGIKLEVLEKLGTPFFTTKDNGTGLGLGVCYAIAARHHAKIEIDTGSEGTTFFVKFEKKHQT
ncbi:C4-dicarboxylate-specific signal transduction histidine kinase [Bacillus benzoevorans]|uniref:histidine kinase n=1 Tax=Bacillus benzoevorans TaxID=1456 RepID=A0A7X0LVF0_9BACI|nr:C4-dicarboxylate-specific signal transduction histidine kinase [Bacillus benzoevorans]